MDSPQRPGSVPDGQWSVNRPPSGGRSSCRGASPCTVVPPIPDRPPVAPTTVRPGCPCFLLPTAKPPTSPPLSGSGPPPRGVRSGARSGVPAARRPDPVGRTRRSSPVLPPSAPDGGRSGGPAGPRRWRRGRLTSWLVVAAGESLAVAVGRHRVVVDDQHRRASVLVTSPCHRLPVDRTDV